MKFLTIVTIFFVVITLGNSAPTFLEWFGFDIDQASDGEEPNLDDESSPTDTPYDTTQILIEVTTEPRQNTETTTEGSGSGDASTTGKLPLLISDDSDNGNEDAPQGNDEVQQGEDGNVIIANPDNQNNEDTDDEANNVESEIQDSWKELEDQLNKEWGQDFTNDNEKDNQEENGTQDNDDSTNEEEETQNNKEGDNDNSNDEDEYARKAIEKYIKENIERSCSYDECNDQCQVQRNYGGYCEYGSRCICF